MPKSSRSEPKKAPVLPKRSIPPPEKKKGPGLLAQTASTAAGVAVGSSIGHIVGNKLAGGSKSEAATGGSAQCDIEWKTFLACSEKNTDQTQCNEAMRNFTDCLKKFDKTK